MTCKAFQSEKRLPHRELCNSAQKKDNIDNDDLFSITPTITLYKNGQGVIHVYGEADDDEKIYKVNRTVTFDFNILGKSTYEITIRSVIKSTLDKVPLELDAQYFPALSKGAIRIVSFSRFNENLIVSISSGAYFICAKNLVPNSILMRL